MTIYTTPSPTYPRNSTDLAAIAKLVEAGSVRPQVRGTPAALQRTNERGPQVDSRSFSLTTASVGELFAAIMSHRTQGKLVIDVVG